MITYDGLTHWVVTADTSLEDLGYEDRPCINDDDVDLDALPWSPPRRTIRPVLFEWEPDYGIGGWVDEPEPEPEPELDPRHYAIRLRWTTEDNVPVAICSICGAATRRAQYAQHWDACRRLDNPEDA